MDGTALKATDAAVTQLRHAAGGSDPWSESEGTTRCRGGFAWRDGAGNRFDVTVSLTRPAPRTPAQRDAARLRDAWEAVMLGDDAAHSTDPDGWHFAVDCRKRALAMEDEGRR